MLRSLLVLVLAGCGACASTVGAPLVHVPLMRRAGQAEAGLIVGTGSRQREVGGTLRAAATDHVRVGGSVSGTMMRDEDRVANQRSRASARLSADGFLGAEWGGLLFRFGALAGSGYGKRSERRGETVRSYGQLHMALAPPGPVALSLAVRVPVLVALAREDMPRRTEVGTEVALTHSFILRHFRLDLQPLWSRLDGFAFHLSFLFRLEP
jgi:hypothetical protein